MNLGLVQTRPAGGAGVSDHALLANLDYAAAAHTGFCALAGAQTITGEKLIDSAVGLRFGHAAGPLLRGPAAGGVLTLTGQLKAVADSLAGGTVVEIAPTGTPTGSYIRHLTVANTLTGLAAGTDYYGFYVVPNVAIPAGSTTCDMYGLWFQGYVKSGGVATVVPNLLGAIFRAGSFGFTGTISNATCLKVDPFHASYLNAVVTLQRGLHVTPASFSCIQNYEAIRVEDAVGPTGNIHLMEIGPATPYLRLVGGAAPGANQTNLYLLEAANLRRVQWKDAAALVAGDRVMVLV